MICVRSRRSTQSRSNCRRPSKKGFYEERRTPTDDELFLLRRIGEIASIAVDNALLHQSCLRELVVRKRTEESVRNLAYHDSLTGLPNRTMLMKYLDKQLTTVHADATGGAVCFVDVDDLKTINDNFGHSCDDKIISLIGADLADELGPDSL